jgi:hypothetical protein
MIDTARPLFARYLDLRPLRGRDRGLVRCVFHEDRTGSLSVDVAQGIFHCFGCGAQGGLRRFRELVGDREPGRAAPHMHRPEPELIAAWREAVRRGRRQYAERGACLPWLFANGTVRVLTKRVDAARRAATALGPDHPRTWRVLESAARVECEALTAEAQLDELLEGGRLHLDAEDAR